MKNYYHCGGMPVRNNENQNENNIRNSCGLIIHQPISQNVSEQSTNAPTSPTIRQNRNRLESAIQAVAALYMTENMNENESDNEEDDLDDSNYNSDEDNSEELAASQGYYNYLNQQEDNSSEEEDDLNQGFTQLFEEGVIVRNIHNEIATIIRYDPDEDTYIVRYEDDREENLNSDEIENIVQYPINANENDNEDEEYRLDLQPDDYLNDDDNLETDEDNDNLDNNEILYLNNLGESIPVPDDTNEIVACSICMVNKPTVAIVNCGHVTLCPDCANQLVNRNDTNCPICREPINGFLRLFFPSGDLKRGGYIFKNLK